MYDYKSAVSSTANLNASNEANYERRNEQAYLAEINRQKRERKMAERAHKNDWWKRMLGNAAGMGLGALGAGLGMGFGPVGMAVGAGLGGGLGGGIADALGGSAQSANAGLQLGGNAAQQQLWQQAMGQNQQPSYSPLSSETSPWQQQRPGVYSRTY